jgi:DNA-binding MarR family transcriptional regulator
MLRCTKHWEAGVSEDMDEVGAELRRAVVRLYSRFRSERAEGEVADAALLVLMVLDKQDRMSLSDLAETARVTLGSMSQTVRRLEQLAYVTKSRGAEDRRKVLFTLTEQGRAAATASRRHRRDWLNGRLAELSAAERADIARVAPLLLRIADS